MGDPDFRWRLVDDDPQGTLFERQRRVVGRGAYRSLTFWEVEARSIINKVPRSGGLPLDYTINPYRGCSHACVYCFARPTHDYLGFGIGEDFDRQIVVKTNAVELTWAETHPSRWKGEPIAMGTNTDPYQKAEGKYHLTRGIIEALAERANPFSILTKSTLVLRDLDLLTEAAQRTDVAVNFSVGTVDEEVWRLTEPGTPHPRQRLEAVRKLNQAGISSGVLVAPLLPGISDGDQQVKEVLAACQEAGAAFASPMLLHLKPGVREHYLAWLADHHPELLPLYEELYRNRVYLQRRRRRSGSSSQPRPTRPTEVEQLRLGL